MARFDRLTVLNTMLSTGLIPVFYHSDLSVARQVVTACAEGGVRVFEFTNRGDGAWHIFNELIAFCAETHPELILGVGSVVDAPTAALYLASGANFVVGPTLNPEIARLCNRRKIAYSPGCGSVSEISAAEELGVEIVKVFPGGQVGGPEFIEAVRGPMPWTRLMPTGGIECTVESVQAWIKAGAACLGLGSKLIPKAALARGDYGAIRDNARRVITWIQAARET
jgi:2-dehydro-3-deoxyphosphogluconate aldolase/(4S)-4-hydroxy-2-oxoglutarate aldolase